MSKPKQKLYLAYGSNLNLEQMKKRCPTAKVVCASEVRDYELLFRGGYGAVATIEPCQGKNVPVLVWMIQPKDEKALDRYEGYPRLYTKESIPVRIGDSIVPVMGYVMTVGHAYGIPSQGYLNTIAEGYASAGFDTKVLREALRHSTEMARWEMLARAAAEAWMEDKEPDEYSEYGLQEDGDPGEDMEMEWGC